MASVMRSPVCADRSDVGIEAAEKSGASVFAESYGAHGQRVTSLEEAKAALAEAKERTDAPTVIEFMIATEEIVLPMVKSGNPMSEMILK